MYKIFVFVAALFCFITSARADIVVINFDTTFGGAPIITMTLVNTAYPDPRFQFGADEIILSGAGSPSLPNFATSQNPLFVGPLDASFNVFVDQVSVANVTFSGLVITAFLNNAVVDSATCPFSISAGCIATVDNLAGIDRVQINPDQSTSFRQYGIDNFTFNTVPEPTSLFLLGAGLAAIGLIRFRRL